MSVGGCLQGSVYEWHRSGGRGVKGGREGRKKEVVEMPWNVDESEDAGCAKPFTTRPPNIALVHFHIAAGHLLPPPPPTHAYSIVWHV